VLPWSVVLALARGCVRLALAAAVIVGLGLSACGRAGPLELPPGPAAAPSASVAPTGLSPAAAREQELAAKNGFDKYGNPVAPAGPSRGFILDPLLQ
jgi:predicted small lipoprotein YifL